jgi:hypothetical protein
MKKTYDSDVRVDYKGEHLGLRIGPDRCQAMIRDHGKKTWSTYGSPDTYPREQKYWTSANGEFGIVRLAVQALRNEITTDMLEILTGAKSFASAQGHETTTRVPKTNGAAKSGPIPIRAEPVAEKAIVTAL